MGNACCSGKGKGNGGVMKEVNKFCKCGGPRPHSRKGSGHSRKGSGHSRKGSGKGRGKGHGRKRRGSGSSKGSH